MFLGKGFATHGVYRRKTLFSHFLDGIVDFSPIGWGLDLDLAIVADDALSGLTSEFLDFAGCALFSLDACLARRGPGTRRCRNGGYCGGWTVEASLAFT